MKLKDIKEGIRLMERYHAKPAKLLMGPKMLDKVVKMLNEKGIATTAPGGQHYIFGLEVIVKNELTEDVAYIEQ